MYTPTLEEGGLADRDLAAVAEDHVQADIARRSRITAIVVAQVDAVVGHLGRDVQHGEGERQRGRREPQRPVRRSRSSG